jgi:hypothetical protein
MSGKFSAAGMSAPAIGPAIVTILGENIPLMAMGLSLAGVVLARFIAPPAKRVLTRAQAWALTLLLCLIDFAAVLTLQPGSGMAVVYGVGLGFSGMLTIEFFGRRVSHVLKALTEAKP